MCCHSGFTVPFIGYRWNKLSTILKGFPGGSDGKESACNVGNPGLRPRLGRSPGKGNDCPLLNILAWKTPWMEEPGRLQSWGYKEMDTTERLTLRALRTFRAVNKQWLQL